MSNYKILVEIINHLDDFEKADIGSDTEAFVLYLKDRVFNSPKVINKIKPDFLDKKNQDYKNFEEVEFSTLLTNLYRFAKHYLKKALKDTSLNSIDEFSFLATLVKEKSLLKSELINRHLLEISTGSEVLRRLIKHNLIEEYKDPDDGRAKRVKLSALGYEQIILAFSEMYKVAQIIKGNLFDDELKEVLVIMKKLSFFHWNIHANDRDTDISDLMKKYIDNE
ncbi:MAG: winged helix-turn-helix transcriptional regulator [Bacteroidales bacterium]|nr:winged helix-turn-helix transcriptional regulator [Bacteroidales bacterium]